MKLTALLSVLLFCGAALCADPNSVACEYAGSNGNLSITVNVPVWPALFGKEIAVYPRGVVIPAAVNEESQPFYKTQLAKFLDRILKNCPDITLNHLKRCDNEFALEGDIKVNGLNLSRILIEEGLAVKKEPPAAESAEEKPELVSEQQPAQPVAEEKEAVEQNEAEVDAVLYCASKNSKIYHLPDCPSAKRITDDNLVQFKTLEEAKAGGRTPCRRCLPENDKKD